jgi:DNA-nicking Smr family endonuclease
MRRRRLRPDEAELWARVIASAAPLHPQAKAGKPAPPTSPAPSPPVQPAALPPLVRPPRPEARTTLDLRPSLPERLATQRPDMDRKTFGRMKRGKLQPEARLDLHGLTQAQAHAELTGFVLLSHEIGRRLVLVITGKGGRGSGGVLRQQVPHWLALPPLKPLVLQIAESHVSHGGAGAFYLYLRRPRRQPPAGVRHSM